MARKDQSEERDMSGVSSGPDDTANSDASSSMSSISDSSLSNFDSDDEGNENEIVQDKGQEEPPSRCSYDLRGRNKATTPASDEAACGQSHDGRKDLETEQCGPGHDPEDESSKDSTIVNVGDSTRTNVGKSAIATNGTIFPPNAARLQAYQACAHASGQPSEASRICAPISMFAASAPMAGDPYMGPGPYTRSKHAKLKASAAIQSQLHVAAAAAVPNPQVSATIPAAAACPLPNPSPIIATNLPGVRPIDASAHPYMINPYLPRSAMDMKAASSAHVAAMNPARVVGGQTFPPTGASLTLDDVSQYWNPNSTDITNLPLFSAATFPASAHVHTGMNATVPFMPMMSAAMPLHVSTTSTCKPSSTAQLAVRGFTSQTSNTSDTSKASPTGTASISAAAHSTTQPATRASSRRNGSRMSGMSKSTSREGNMSKAERRRNKASIRERKRVVSLNEAFLNLKKAMPFVPPDTKLSKIKTLRFAIRYVKRMMDMLSESGEKQGSNGVNGGNNYEGGERLDVFDPCGCFGTAYGPPFDDFDLEMDFSSGSQPTLPEVPITINDSDLEN